MSVSLNKTVIASCLRWLKNVMRMAPRLKELVNSQRAVMFAEMEKLVGGMVALRMNGLGAARSFSTSLLLVVVNMLGIVLNPMQGSQ